MAEKCDDYQKQRLIDKALQWQTSTQLAIAEDVLLHSSINDRLSDTEAESETIELHAPYNELINRQFSALQLQFERS